ncbi:MAG: hypothetical protein ABJ263_18605 [Tateyamaria sp.]|uniref:hypothetical protein n=1 Tax=Tateyamaria sp. TaxID=1929288 RepID=UPI00328D023B
MGRNQPLEPDAHQMPDDAPLQTARSLPTVGRIATEFGCLVLLMILVPLIVLLDVKVLSGRVSETSLTELAQAGSILTTAILFFIGTRRFPEAVGYLMSVATLCAWMFIRENDAYFDAIRHGFWVVPNTILLGIGALFAYRHRDTLKNPFRQHAATREAVFMMVGFVIIVIFSRVFGSGELWRPIMGETYNPAFKAAVQESLELLGYALMVFGAVLSFRAGFGQVRRAKGN